VADSSLARDRSKARLYAAAGVTEYWIVNWIDERVEVHREPNATGYARVLSAGRGETLRLVAFADVAVPVADVLPPPES
jgi:Uma2 family endonuclease